jgi:hypothetical protein
MSGAKALDIHDFPVSTDLPECKIGIYEMAEAKMFRIINMENVAGCPVYITRNVLSGKQDSKIKVPLTEKYKLDELEKTLVAGMVLAEARDVDGRTSLFCGQCKHIGCEYHG